jgi:hypothetical protein
MPNVHRAGRPLRVAPARRVPHYPPIGAPHARATPVSRRAKVVRSKARSAPRGGAGVLHPRENAVRDYYVDWGFLENPLQPNALNPDDRGERLLVGRESELDVVCRRLHKQKKITCVEGPVGFGKTSLVNIAAHKCFKAFARKETDQLLIPCRQTFQLDRTDTTESFSLRVFLAVAQTLLELTDNMKGLGLSMEGMSQVDNWLNSPRAKAFSMGLGGVSAGMGIAPNASSGFAVSGFETRIIGWLQEIFRTHGNGGVVCIVDNLELLETTAKARATLEALRDRLFSTVGLRWVFCGAHGVVHSIASSPRLNGFTTRPVVEVNHLSPEATDAVLASRIREFAVNPDKAYLPILEASFNELYKVLNFNLRDLLSYADNYCTEVFDSNVAPQNDAGKSRRFEGWLRKETVDQYRSLQSRIHSDAWTILDTAMGQQFAGTFGPGDYPVFRVNDIKSLSEDAFHKFLRSFEKHGLLDRSVREGDVDEARQTLYSVTSKGALVHYARVQTKEARVPGAVDWLKRSSQR